MAPPGAGPGPGDGEGFRLRSTVDLERDGKQRGTLWVPDPRDNRSAWGNVAVPIGCIRNGSGPTVVVSAGNHGDEYEGQLALFGLLAELDAGDVAGRLIVLPSLSAPAASAGTRLWPDGSNFNRSFPGSASGGSSGQLARYLTSSLFPLADAVCDFHTGGSSLSFLPMATLHLVEDEDQRRRMIDAAVAMGTDSILAYVDVNGGGLLPTQVESLGKVMVSAELGGGGRVTVAAVADTKRWIRNVLSHFGVLAATHVAMGRGAAAKAPRVLRATEAGDYVLAPCAGLYEPLVELGAAVAAGAMIGRIWSLDGADRPSEPVTSETAGVVCALRALTATVAGDCLALVAQESSLDALVDDGTNDRS